MRMANLRSRTIQLGRLARLYNAGHDLAAFIAPDALRGGGAAPDGRYRRARSSAALPGRSSEADPRPYSQPSARSALAGSPRRRMAVRRELGLFKGAGGLLDYPLRLAQG